MRPSLFKPLGVLGALLLPAAAPAFAQNGNGPVSVQECCLPLLFRYPARAVAMGEALTSQTNPDGLFYNPAALAGNRKDEFLIHHQDTFEGQNNAFTIMIDAGVAGAFGFTYVLIDQGEEESGTGPVPTGTLSIRHHIVTASYATQVTTGVRAGVSYKLYNFTLGCTGFCDG